MNKSLEMDFDFHFGLGPQLVIVGAIIGSIIVGTLSYLISDTLFDPINFSSKNNHVVVNNVDQINEVPIQCQVSSQFSNKIMQWCDEISHFSTNFGLPPNLIAAVMLQESGGDPNAYSHSGAVGLMQIMPSDGIASSFTCINGPCFKNRPTMKELQDPVFNIEFGTRMLAGLISKYGNFRDALKFYGPMDVGYSYADKVLAIYENYQ